MENEFLSYEVAHLLNSTDFNMECLGYYNSNGDLMQKSSKGFKSGILKQDLHEYHVLAPLYQQVARWLNEFHQIHIAISTKEVMDAQIKIACKQILV